MFLGVLYFVSDLLNQFFFVEYIAGKLLHVWFATENGQTTFFLWMCWSGGSRRRSFEKRYGSERP